MQTRISRSRHIIEHAQNYIPGGVSSSNRYVEPQLVFKRAQGAYLFDVEGQRYIDYHGAFGPSVLGYAHAEVDQRVIETLGRGGFAALGANELEAQLAEKICHHVPCAEKVLFCNSGSEATYMALRVARAATGRNKIIKFQGCYHGWHDAVALNFMSDPEKIEQKDPLSAGMLPQVIDNTFVLPFNDLAAVEETLRQHGQEIAALILEPIQHNIGCILPRQGFLEGLRALTRRYGVVLIFDEVITGFRHGLGGYQKIAGVTPDLTTMAKAVANGYPLALLAGRGELMDLCRPGGSVFMAGTFNAHSVGVAAALATLEILERPGSYAYLFSLGERMRQGLRVLTGKYDLKATVAGFGSVFVTYFTEPPIENYADLLRNDAALFVNYRRTLIVHGVYKLPVNLKRAYISMAHTVADIDQTLAIVDAVLAELVRMKG